MADIVLTDVVYDAIAFLQVIVGIGQIVVFAFTLKAIVDYTKATYEIRDETKRSNDLRESELNNARRAIAPVFRHVGGGSERNRNAYTYTLVNDGGLARRVWGSGKDTVSVGFSHQRSVPPGGSISLVVAAPHHADEDAIEFDIHYIDATGHHGSVRYQATLSGHLHYLGDPAD